MKTLHLYFSPNEKSGMELTMAVLAGRQGFWNITADNVLSCDQVTIWSAPETNSIGRSVQYTAPITGVSRVKWNNSMRSVIHFDASHAQWEENRTDRPDFNRNGWVML